MIMGAIAKIGIVWDAIAHGITLIFIALLWTIPIANNIPREVPIKKPTKVEERVIQL
jgi:hypothetical protein